MNSTIVHQAKIHWWFMVVHLWSWKLKIEDKSFNRPVTRPTDIHLTKWSEPPSEPPNCSTGDFLSEHLSEVQRETPKDGTLLEFCEKIKPKNIKHLNLTNSHDFCVFFSVFFDSSPTKRKPNITSSTHQPQPHPKPPALSHVPPPPLWHVFSGAPDVAVERRGRSVAPNCPPRPPMEETESSFLFPGSEPWERTKKKTGLGRFVRVFFWGGGGRGLWGLFWGGDVVFLVGWLIFFVRGGEWHTRYDRDFDGTISYLPLWYRWWNCLLWKPHTNLAASLGWRMFLGGSVVKKMFHNCRMKWLGRIWNTLTWDLLMFHISQSSCINDWMREDHIDNSTKNSSFEDASFCFHLFYQAKNQTAWALASKSNHQTLNLSLKNCIVLGKS